jgi:hypothetical protein
MFDGLLSRKLVDVYLMKRGISYNSINQMCERDVMEYYFILQEMDKIEMESMEKNIRR